MAETFTPWTALAGGAALGLAALLLLALVGRIAGISGIVGGLVAPTAARVEIVWRVVFVAGLLVGGLIALVAMPSTMSMRGLAARPGTDVLPTCSSSRTRSPRTARIASASRR